eukprot:m.39882 g.39882  ORF g.39882 m.39882 type:complete len:397 (-) comp5879_c0_seq2:99-1289(-)
MSRRGGKKKRPSLPPISPGVGHDSDGFGSEDGSSAHAVSSELSAGGFGFGPAGERGGGDSAALEVFCVKAKEIEGWDLTDCKRIKSLHEHEGRWVDVVKVKGSDRQLVRKTVQLGRSTSTLSQGESYLKTVKNELELLQKLDSPLIVHHFGSILTESNEVQIFMEEMDAGSLDNLLPRVGRMTEPMIARVCLKVSEGLHYLWTEHRAIHRDIKPGNILVNTHGEIKLCDFGTSRILDAPGQNGVTFIGTMNYMSPERLEGNRHAITGDVFSLGLMLMELASGYPRIPMDRDKYPHPELAEMRKKSTPGFKIRPKYEHKRIAPFDVMKEISQQEITFPAVAEGGFTRGFVDLTIRMLTKKPEERVPLADIVGNPWCKSGASQEEFEEYVKWSLTDPD